MTDKFYTQVFVGDKAFDVGIPIPVSDLTDMSQNKIDKLGLEIGKAIGSIMTRAKRGDL